MPQGSGPGGASKPAVDDPARARHDLSTGLYLVATPIGNATDITLRAINVLREVDVIACEDTRVTAKLLAIHGITNSLTPYHEHNARAAGPALLQRIRRGQRVALVSDAGTPLVSDPGYRLVRACIDDNISVVPVPGPSAVTTALTVAGLATDRFLFAGFPPTRNSRRRVFFEELVAVPATLAFMESPRRLAASLADMHAVFGDREAVVARELTKMFEEVKRGTLAQLAEFYDQAGPPKGEIMVIVARAEPRELDDDEVDRRLTQAMQTQTLRQAVDDLTRECGRSRRDVYARAIALKKACP